MTQDLNIYVASLSDYNAGRLVGAWIECEGKDEEDLRAEITAMLATSQESVAEEWAIHDHEGFGSLDIGEYTPMSEVAEMCELIEDHEDVAMAAASWLVGLDEIREACEDKYHGCFDSLENWAYDLCQDMGYMDELPSLIECHIDFESIARDLTMSDYHAVRMDGNYYIFSNC